MPTRLLLDGEDLPALMRRVKAEMGPGARIVKAERVRTGGIGGFFAKEHYELTVEVPDPVHPGRRIQERAAAADARAAGAAGPAVPVGIDALLAAADAAEGREAGGAAGPTAAGEDDGGAPAGATTAGTTAGGGSEGAGPSAASAAASAAARAQQVPEPPPAPEISTTGPTFAEVLESLGQLVGDDPGPATDAADAEDTVELSGATGPVLEVPPTGAGTAPVTSDASGATVGAMLELGLPTALLAGLGDLRAPVTLSTLVRRFPTAPVLRLDAGVVVVVGTPDAALRTAMGMAYRADVDPHEVVLAGDGPAVPGHGRRVTTAAAAARLRSRAADGVTLVALGLDSGSSPSADLLDALAPDQTWAVVDAGRRAAETRRWLREVGARHRVDALAAMGTFEAQSPGAVLNLGVPVGWVDGLPVSPVVWAAVLSERLADDARWE